MNAESIRIECDEDGFHLKIETDEDDEYWYSFRVLNPEALYDSVKAEIGPWLRERDMALATYRTDPASPGFTAADADAYDPTDPKHPTYHERMSALYDSREGK